MKSSLKFLANFSPGLSETWLLIKKNVYKLKRSLTYHSGSLVPDPPSLQQEIPRSELVSLDSVQTDERLWI